MPVTAIKFFGLFFKSLKAIFASKAAGFLEEYHTAFYTIQSLFYELYTNLRNAKFPEFISASFDIDKSSELPCLVDNGIIKLLIMNGPDIPIAQSEFINIYDVTLTNANSIIPGF